VTVKARMDYYEIEPSQRYHLRISVHTRSVPEDALFDPFHTEKSN
jgi:hypothetical protein